MNEQSQGNPLSVDAATAAAMKVAASLGVDCTNPRVLSDGSNVLVHLYPTDLVAKVATLTAVIRPDVHEFLARDIEVARFLDARGMRVALPSADPPAGPYDVDGIAVSLWRYLPQDGAVKPAPAEVVRLQGDLHAALRDYPGELPVNGPSEDVARMLDLHERNATLDGRALRALRAENERIADRMRDMPAQPLHGDAHPGNLLTTPNGLVWSDFEDTWRGPVAWDLACLADFDNPLGASEVVAGYPNPPSAEDLLACVQMRHLYGVAWLFLLAKRFPEYEPGARYHLTGWMGLYGKDL